MEIVARLVMGYFMLALVAVSVPLVITLFRPALGTPLTGAVMNVFFVVPGRAVKGFLRGLLRL
jgi:hypothetical protein